MALELEGLTERIIGAAIEVHKELGQTRSLAPDWRGRADREICQARRALGADAHTTRELHPSSTGNILLGRPRRAQHWRTW